MTGTDDTPPPPPSSAVPRRRTSLVGREDDVAAVLERLRGAQLVTLLGVGGVGKTRLAYEAASRVERIGDAEVHVVELAATTDDDAVARVVADALHLPPTSGQSPIDALVARLAAAGPVLLLLDNCEQVVAGAAAVVDELLDRCDDLTVVATSRVPLHVEGEQLWPVEPLQLDGDDEAEAPAIALLVERARAAHPRALEGADHEQLHTLARRLDGVPLALELAAARLATLDLTELLAHLDDHLLGLESSQRGTAERHRTLAGVVDWSYRLLDDEGRALAAGLSVFRGSFTRDAATVVLGIADPGRLDRLTEVSLLTVTDRGSGSRLLMLEMIRAYLSEQLDESGRGDEVRRAHATWAASLVTELRAAIRGPDEAAARARLANELDNIGAALEWAVGAGETALVVELVRGLHDHLLAVGGRAVHAWVERAVEGVWDQPAAGDVLLVASAAAMVRGDIVRYRQLLEQADALGIEGDDVPVSRALEWASLLVFEGRVDDAVVIAEQLADDIPDDPWKASHTLMRLAQPHAFSGGGARALALTDRSIEAAERTGNPTALSWARYVHGEGQVVTDPFAAIESYHEALRLAESVGNSFLIGLQSVALASSLGRHGDPVEALEQFRATIERWRDVGGWAFQSTTLRNLGELLARIDRPEEATLVRCALENLEASSEAGGIDAERDRRLRRQLRDRLGSDRFDELRDRSRSHDRASLVALALETIDDELRRRRRVSEFRVIVFTDLEDSTAYMAGQGDEAARALLRQYDLRTDDAIARHRGERVKGTGDGVLATFPSVADALDFVTELAREVDDAVAGGELPLRLRIGVHAGETIADLGDVHGTVVNLTARVVDRADGGEILVTDTIRQIAVGSDRTFTALGLAEMKGIPEPIALHRLEWR